MMEIFKEFVFEAAHFLPLVPEGHQCARLHGHSYRVEVHVSGPVDPKTGWVIDFGEISDAFRPIRDELDHRLLNDVDGLDNPTSEQVATWIWGRLAAHLPLCAVVVRETAGSGCIYRGEDADALRSAE